MLETFMVDHTKGHRRLSGISSDRLLSALYDSLPFMICSRVWREVANYEAKSRAGSAEAGVFCRLAQS